MTEEQENITCVERLSGFEPVRATEIEEGYRVPPKFNAIGSLPDVSLLPFP
jgi:hypothetical protein